MSSRYVKVKVYKKTIGKACIVSSCHKSAKVTAERKNGGMTMSIALCPEHAAERSLVDAA